MPPLTAAQRARRAQRQAEQRAYEQTQGNAIAQYGAQYAAGTVGANGAPPPAAAGPASTPPPVDAAFEAQKLGAQWNVSTSNAEAAYQTGQTAYSSGYNADGSTNASNPYSQAQLLQDTFKRSVTGTNNSMAASGNLYSGARLNAQGANDRRYSQDSDAQRRAAMGAYHQIGVGQLQTYGANATGVSAADYDSLRRSIYGS